jgi:hypothetical protein
MTTPPLPASTSTRPMKEMKWRWGNQKRCLCHKINSNYSLHLAVPLPTLAWIAVKCGSTPPIQFRLWLSKILNREEWTLNWCSNIIWMLWTIRIIEHTLKKTRVTSSLSTMWSIPLILMKNLKWSEKTKLQWIWQETALNVSKTTLRTSIIEIVSILPKTRTTK